VRAVPVDGGYRLSGQWPFNSGASNADWMSVAAVIFDGKAPRMGQFGPEMVFAVLHPGDVEIIDTWSVTGLCGTSSHDLRVTDLFVPGERTGSFSLATGPRAVRDSVLARFPLFTLLGLAQSPPVCLGIARHALDSFRDLALAKVTPFGGRLSDQVQAQVGIARAEAALRSARSYWFETVRCAWESARAGRELTLDTRAELRMASLNAVESSVCAVDSAFRLSGSTAIFQAQDIERCWRDVHTAAQHLQVQDGRWETAGRVLFGLDPASPLI
jgi:alkylation response protein AidB-like acyl-CoA dehydrogenase